MVGKKKLIYADDLLHVLCDDININGSNLARVRRHIDAAPAVEMPKTPCDLCRFNPPSSCDGKPCTMCVAEGSAEDG